MASILSSIFGSGESDAGQASGDQGTAPAIDPGPGEAAHLLDGGNSHGQPSGHMVPIAGPDDGDFAGEPHPADLDGYVTL